MVKLKMGVAARDAWIYLADTSKLYRAAFMPRRHLREESGKLIGGQTLLFFKEEWVEEPWTWVFGRSIDIRRTYRRGMAKTMHARFDVEETGPSSCALTLKFDWVPNGLFWRLGIWASIPLQKLVSRFIFKKIENHIVESSDEHERFDALKTEHRSLSPAAQARLARIRDELYLKELSPDVVDLVVDWVQKTDELDAYRFQVKPLARKWHVSQRELAKVCLHATRLGLLTISWDVICPHCRGVRFEAANLGSIPQEGDCDVCEVDFKTDRLEAIEVTFHIHPSIREVKEVKFCAAEASKKAHIKVQVTVPPGRELRARPLLDEGHHRLRLKGRKGGRPLLVSADASRRDVIWTTSGESETESECGTAPVLHLRNDEPEPVTFVLEEQRWRNIALLPAEVFLFREFHDLFSEEHLHVDVRLSLGQQTILFTDIVGSTRYYQEVGDGRAFREVKSHFNEVFAVVEKHGGCVVKTIGDSIMAVFPSSTEGVKASVDIQRLFPVERTDSPIRLRISVHSGPVIAVHIKQGIDFFGATVNLAAKLQNCADAHEIAVSPEVYRQFSETETVPFPTEKRALKTRFQEDPIDSIVIRVAEDGETRRTA